MQHNKWAAHAAILILLGAAAAFGAGQVSVMDPITKLPKYLKGGEGISINGNSGTITATGTAVIAGNIPFDNISTGIRGKYLPINSAAANSNAYKGNYAPSATEFSYLDGVTAPIQGQISSVRVTAEGKPSLSNVTPLMDGIAAAGTGPTAARVDHIHPVDTSREPANANIQTHIGSTSNPHSVTKSQVGLGNVDNTSDANKPVSTATQTALNLKANTSSLATVATTGSYTDLTNKPAVYTLPTASTTVKGGVKIDGTSIVVDGNGVISSTVSAGVSTVNGGTGDVTVTPANIGAATLLAFTNYTSVDRPARSEVATAAQGVKADSAVQATAVTYVIAPDTSKKADFYCSSYSGDCGAAVQAALTAANGSARIEFTPGYFPWVTGATSSKNNVVFVSPGEAAYHHVTKPITALTISTGTSSRVYGNRLYGFNWVMQLATSPTVTGNGTTVTVTTGSAHGYTTGDSIWMRGWSGGTGAWNGVYTVTVTDTTHFTYSATGNGTPTGGRASYPATAVKSIKSSQQYMTDCKWTDFATSIYAEEAWDHFITNPQIFESGSGSTYLTGGHVIRNGSANKTAGYQVLGGRTEAWLTGMGSAIVMDGSGASGLHNDTILFLGHKLENYHTSAVVVANKSDKARFISGNIMGVTSNIFDVASDCVNWKVQGNEITASDASGRGQAMQSVVKYAGGTLDFSGNTYYGTATNPAVVWVTSTGSAANVRNNVSNYSTRSTPWAQNDGSGNDVAVYGNSYAPNLTEDLFSFSDLTTANVSTTKHGLAPKLPNDATKYLDGTGSYSVPPGSAITLQTNTVNNGSQSKLNLIAGSNVTITDGGTGNVTIASTASGTGNVTGPASSTTGHIATFADGTGKVLADGGTVVAGSDHQIQYNNAGVMAGAVNSYVDATTGRITIGSTTAPSTSAVKISSTSTTDADGLTIGRTSPTLNNAATNFTIANISAAFADNSPVANSVALGVNLQPQYSGSGSLNTLRGLFITPRNIGTAGTTGTLEGVAVWPRNTSTGTIGFYMNSFHAITPTNAGTVTGVSTRGLLIDNQGLAGSASSYGIKVEDQSGATSNYAIQTGAGLVSFGGLMSAPAATWTQGSSTTIDTAATTGATISSSGATSLTITNVVSGRYFDFKVTSSGGGALSFVTLTPTWVTGTPASITAGKSSWFVCKGTGANTADCAAIKENF